MVIDGPRSGNQRAVEAFLAGPHGSRLAGATTALERAGALNDWLNAHDVPVEQDLVEMRSMPHDSAAGSAGPAIPLPAAPCPDIGLVDALYARRSRYDYDRDAPLPVDALSALLRHGVGLGRRVPAYGRADYPLSVAPSGGGLNSVAVYVALRAVQDLPPGIYHYERFSHALVPHTPGDPTERLREVYLQPDFPAGAAASLVLVGRLARVLAKYPLRQYRVLHIDAGIAVQNLYLMGTALGLAGCAVTGYRDSVLSDLLRLGGSAVPTAIFAVGPGTGSRPA